MSTMRRRRPSFGFTSVLNAVLTLAVALGARGAVPGQETAAAPPPPAQEESELTLAEQELLLRLSQQYAEAQELFEDPQRQSQSIDFLSEIVDVVEEERRVRDDVAEELVELQRRALELRARAFFNAGQLRGAEDDFRRIILDDPRYGLDAESLSPRIVDFFEEQKKQLIGYLAVTTEPAGARVTVNGNFVGITNFFPIEVHTGIARVEVSLVGYDGYVDGELRIAPGEITTLDLELTRTSARLPIITDPPGVEIVVDGESVGETSGALPPDLRSFMPAELDPARLSAPFDLAALPLGQHEIELRRDCYETVRFPFHAEAPQDYTAQIVKLQESVGSVTISSNPSDARVYLDGELRGNTPLELSRVCSGEHRLEVTHATGKYVEDIVVARDEALFFEGTIRPTLAVLGFVAEEGVSPRDVADIEQQVSTELRTLEVMNVVFPDRADLLDRLGTRGLSTLLPSENVEDEDDAERIRETSERLGDALEVEALLIGYVPAQRLTKDVVLHFLAVGSPRPDRYALNYLDREELPRFLEKLSTPTPLFASWVGLTAVDTRLAPGPIVLAVEEGGPAAEAGVRPGDIIEAAKGQPVSRTLDVLRAVESTEPGDALSLSVIRDGSSAEIAIAVGTTPIEIPMNDADFLYNKAIVDLRHRMVTEPEIADLAQLNVGLCYMQLGDYETALKDYLPGVTLPDTRGISQGTVYYYTALAYLKLGERAEAARIFQQALGYGDATLQSNDGPRVPPLAERRLREIGR